LRVQTFRLTHN